MIRMKNNDPVYSSGTTPPSVYLARIAGMNASEAGAGPETNPYPKEDAVRHTEWRLAWHKSRVWREGLAARNHGMSINKNPYKRDTRIEELPFSPRDEWRRGWSSGIGKRPSKKESLPFMENRVQYFPA